MKLERPSGSLVIEDVMIGPSLRRNVRITNPQGFHLRPKAAFAQMASKFKSAVTVHWEGLSSNGKSIFELMLVAAPQGSELVLEALGPDAPDALEALSALLLTPTED